MASFSTMSFGATYKNFGLGGVYGGGIAENAASTGYRPFFDHIRLTGP